MLMLPRAAHASPARDFASAARCHMLIFFQPCFYARAAVTIIDVMRYAAMPRAIIKCAAITTFSVAAKMLC